jgi:hypothetical protein
MAIQPIGVVFIEVTVIAGGCAFPLTTGTAALHHYKQKVKVLQGKHQVAPVEEESKISWKSLA